MIPSISKDQAYQNVQPLIKELMKDEQQEVRKGGIEAAAKFVEVLGPETFSALNQSFKACSEDPKWRVRLVLLENLTNLGIALQNYDLYLKHIEPFHLNYLKDRASAIRDVGIKTIPHYCKIFADSWVTSMLLKLDDILSKEASYHFKIAAIYSLKEIALSDNGDKYTERCLGQIFKVTADPVPNVREVSIKALRDIAHKFDNGLIKESIKKEIMKMSGDADHEVRATAAEVLSRM